MQAYAVYQTDSPLETERASRRYARVAGILYLVTHVTSVFAVVAYGAGLIPAGVTLEFALALGCAGTGILLWHLLRAFGPVRAATFAVLRGVEAAVILAGTLPMLAMAWVGTAGSFAELLTATHAASFLVGQGLVISGNTIVLGWLLWGSRAVLRPLAALGMVGGALVLVSNLSQLWGVIALNGSVAAAAAIPVFAFELWLAITLIVRGFRAPVES